MKRNKNRNRKENRRKKPYFKQIGFGCKLAVLLVMITFAACSGKTPKYIATSATIEAGTAFTAEDFLLEEGHTASFSGEFKEYGETVTLHHVGEYRIELLVDDSCHEISVTVQDTIAPLAAVGGAVVCEGEMLTAEQCVTQIKDETTITYEFLQAPDVSKAGEYTTEVIITDEGGNRISLPVTISVLSGGEPLKKEYTIEAGTKVPAVEELIGVNRKGRYLTDITSINTSLIGVHSIEVEMEGKICTTSLRIVDTVSPIAIITPQKAYYGAQYPSADSFVSGIIDEGPVTVSYESEPPADVRERVNVRIVLTDQGGNTSVYDSYCSVEQDKEPPKFTAVPECLEADVGTTVIWRAMTGAEDNSGRVELSLDTSNANMNKPGEYLAELIARDPAGNEVRQEVKLILHDNSVTKAMMDSLCESILKTIIKEDMTPKEKMSAVYRYIRSKVSYTNAGVHDDVRREAYLGLTTRGSGDCFTFCAAGIELFSRLGYDSMIVKREQECARLSGSNHFWLLVNVGTEKEPLWYHFDATPIRAPFNRDTYMMTDAQLKAYTKYRESSTPKKLYYYTFDTSLYPASATEMVTDLKIDEKYYE